MGEELHFSFCAGEGGVCESKARKPTPILSVRSAVLEQREVMLAWRCWILGLPGLSSRIDHMDVKMLSMWIFASSLSYIHLHTSKMTCLGLSFIYWAIFLFNFSRDRG